VLLLAPRELRANRWLNATCTSPRALPRSTQVPLRGRPHARSLARSVACARLVISSSAQRALSARDRLNARLSPLIAYSWRGVATRSVRCFAVCGSPRLAPHRPHACGIACTSFASRTSARSPHDGQPARRPILTTRRSRRLHRPGHALRALPATHVSLHFASRRPHACGIYSRRTSDLVHALLGCGAGTPLLQLLVE
jgi:hypothetical protein